MGRGCLHVKLNYLSTSLTVLNLGRESLKRFAYSIANAEFIRNSHSRATCHLAPRCRVPIRRKDATGRYWLFLAMKIARKPAEALLVCLVIIKMCFTSIALGTLSAAKFTLRQVCPITLELPQCDGQPTSQDAQLFIEGRHQKISGHACPVSL